MDGKIMKLKLLAAIFLFPFVAMAANTNVYDNVRINNNFQFLKAPVAVNNILVSDGAGYWTPTTIAVLSGFAYTNQNNFFTTASTNTFNAPTFTSNMFVRGYLGINTNGPLSTSISLYSRAPVGVATNFARIEGIGSANFAGYTFGDINGNPYGRLSTDGGGNVILMVTNSTSYIIQINGENQFVGTATSSTFGNNASDTYTFNGTTVTIPNGLNIAAGQLIIPSTGTLTNQSSFTSLNKVQGSNIVATTTDGIFRLSSGTNMTGILDVNQGAGVLQTKAMYTVSTNTPAGINPAVNVINTNGSQVAYVSINCAFGANAGAFLWTSTALSPKARFFTPTAGTTNYIVGWVQPSALWAISNYVGTVTAIPGEGHVETH